MSQNTEDDSSPIVPGDALLLRQLYKNIYLATRDDIEFTMLTNAYEGSRYELVDVLYEVIADDLRARREFTVRTLRHVVIYLANMDRYAEAAVFCDVWCRQHANVECWKFAALLACKQGYFARWRRAYEEVDRLGATEQVKLIIEIAERFTFDNGTEVNALARQLMATLLPGHLDPIIQQLIEDAAIACKDGALLVELSGLTFLDSPKSSRREAIMMRLLRSALLDVLRGRSVNEVGER